jgi:AAA domain
LSFEGTIETATKMAVFANGAPRFYASIYVPKAAPETDPGAQMPSVKAMHQQLLDLDFLDEEIEKMTPEGMWKRIRMATETAWNPEPEPDDEEDDFPEDDGGDPSPEPGTAQIKYQEVDETGRPRVDQKGRPIMTTLVIVNAGYARALPSPRQWLLGNAFCRKYLSGLIGTGGTGKTAYRHAQYMALATGLQLTGEHVFERVRILFLSFEDDEEELHRRLYALAKFFDIDPKLYDGWLFFLPPERMRGLKLAIQDKRGKVVTGGLESALRAAITELDIGLIGLDPLIKAHAVDENDNVTMDKVVSLVTQMVRLRYRGRPNAPHA